MSTKTYLIQLAGFTALVVGIAACSSDDNAAPEKPPVVGTGGKKSGNPDGGSTGGKSGAGTGGAPSEGPDSGSGGEVTGSGGTAGTGGKTGGTGGKPPADVDGGNESCKAGELGDKGCFKCPQSTTEFHNQCTDSTCYPFDNSARLPLFKGYPLPTL